MKQTFTRTTLFLLTFIFLSCGSGIASLVKGAEQMVDETIRFEFKDNQDANASIRTLELALVEHKFKKQDERTNQANPTTKTVIYMKDTFAERFFLGTGTTIAVTVMQPTKDANYLQAVFVVNANAKRMLEARKKLQGVIAEIQETYNNL